VIIASVSFHFNSKLEVYDRVIGDFSYRLQIVDLQAGRELFLKEISPFGKMVVLMNVFWTLNIHFTCSYLCISNNLYTKLGHLNFPLYLFDAN
jgi:hypothetical protein